MPYGLGGGGVKTTENKIHWPRYTPPEGGHKILQLIILYSRPLLSPTLSASITRTSLRRRWRKIYMRRGSFSLLPWDRSPASPKAGMKNSLSAFLKYEIYRSEKQPAAASCGEQLTLHQIEVRGRGAMTWPYRSNFAVKGINRPFGRGVESILIQSVFVNWRLGKIFYLILNGLYHKISKKLLYAA